MGPKWASALGAQKPTPSVAMPPTQLRSRRIVEYSITPET
jgi:hypothetical protein